MHGHCERSDIMRRESEGERAIGYAECMPASERRRGRIGMHRAIMVGSFCLLLWAASGCMSSKITSPDQTGIEQLLLGTAADRALAQIDFSAFRDRVVFVDARYLDAYRAHYVTASLRDKLGAAGAWLTDERNDAEFILEPRASALSIDESETMVGLPSISVPVPMSGGLAIPEAALYKSFKQNSIGKLAVTGYSARRDAPAISLGPAVGRAYYNRWWMLFAVSFRTTDLPEK